MDVSDCSLHVLAGYLKGGNTFLLSESEQLLADRSNKQMLARSALSA